MQEKHAGKWTLVDDGVHFSIPEAGIQWMRSHSTDPIRDAEIRTSGQGRQETATAHLLVSAPALYEVVRGFRQKLVTYVDVYKGDKELRRLLDECDAALALAEGKAK